MNNCRESCCQTRTRQSRKVDFSHFCSSCCSAQFPWRFTECYRTASLHTSTVGLLECVTSVVTAPIYPRHKPDSVKIYPKWTEVMRTKAANGLNPYRETTSNLIWRGWRPEQILCPHNTSDMLWADVTALHTRSPLHRPFCDALLSFFFPPVVCFFRCDSLWDKRAC